MSNGCRGNDIAENHSEMIDMVKCGDCVKIMQSMPTESVDLTVTSPPYDNLRSYDGYSFDFEATARELFRVTKRGGVVVWIVSDATINGSESGTSFRQALGFIEAGFRLHDTMIWEKDTFNFPDKTRYRQCMEYMFVLSKGKPAHINLISDRKNKFYGAKIHGTNRLIDGSTTRKSNHNKSKVSEYGVRFNVWKFPTEKKNKTGHPAVFPEELVRDHILSWSNPLDVVFDPFLGSGTTAVSAIKAGRHYAGCDISERYCKIAEQRIAEAKAEIL